MTVIDRCPRTDVPDDRLPPAASAPQAAHRTTTAPFPLRTPPRQVPPVARPRLVAQLTQAAEVPLVLLIAPPGWGKSTLLAQWARVEPRPVRLLAVTEEDDEPGTLADHVADLLAGDHGAAPPDHRQPPGAGDRPPRPVLVLDDVHHLQSPAALDCLRHVIAALTLTGGQVILSGRAAPPLPLGRARVSGHLFELGAAQLAMDADEAGALLAAMDVTASPAEVGRLLARTEGWATGLHLAVRAVRESADPNRRPSALQGTDRAVAEYLRQEVLGVLSPDTRRFLTRISVLDQLSGAACDALLGVVGSGARLEALTAAGRACLVPLDREQRRYRFHPLLRDLLRAELRHSEPERRRDLHRRATRWYAGQDDLERTMHHAGRAGELDRAGELLLGQALQLAGSDRHAVLERCLRAFRPEQLAGHPGLALSAACHHLVADDIGLVPPWLATTARALGAQTTDDLHAGRLAELIAAWVGLRSGDAPGAGPVAPGADTGPSDPWWPLACLLEGVAQLVAGRPAALVLLSRAELGARTLPLVHLSALAHLAIAHAEAGDWDRARRLADQALAATGRAGLLDCPLARPAPAVAALVRSHDGDGTGAGEALRHLRHPAGPDLDPARAALVDLVAARAQLLAGDRTAAGRSLDCAELLLPGVAPAQRSGLSERLRARRADLDGAPAGADPAVALTPAERRVLELLPTHLTIADIAQRLFVSRNTVKSQATAVYQKLGATNRGEAVERAVSLRLLEG